MADGANHIFVEPIFQVAHLRHFSTKTADEYALKMQRGYPDQKWGDTERIKDCIENIFFKTNVRTKEKVDIFNERLHLDLPY